MKKVRIGVIGAGGMGRTHALGYRKDERSELTALCDVDRALTDRLCAGGDWPSVDYGDALVSLAAQPPVEKAYYETSDLAADPDIDAVSICLPNKLHAPVALEMIEAGKSVLLEKPMALNARECRALMGAAKERGVVLQVGHMWRFHRDVDMIRSIVQAGHIGTVVKVKGYGIHDNWGPDGWFVDKDLAGGGALIDMGVHAIDTIAYVLGDPKPVDVYARVETRFADYEVDDSAVVIIRYESDVTAVVESGWRNPYKDGDEASCQFFGTRGYARIFPTEVRFNLERRWGRFEPLRQPGEISDADEIVETYFRQTSAFVDAITGKAPNLVPGEVGLSVMEIVDAAYESTKRGEVVRL